METLLLWVGQAYMAVQIAGWIVTLLAILFERPDPRFEGDKLIYRS